MAVEIPSDIMNRYDYLNPNLWEFTFVDELDMKFLIKNVSLPFIGFETDGRGTGEKYYTGYTPEEEFSIEFLETKDLKVLEYLEDWMDTVYDKKLRVFNTGDHTKNGILNIQSFVGNSGLLNAFGKTLNTETIKTYGFVNMLIVRIDNIDWDYEGTDAKRITASFTADIVGDFLEVYFP
jgi:hypothetical protein